MDDQKKGLHWSKKITKKNHLPTRQQLQTHNVLTDDVEKNWNKKNKRRKI